MRKNITRAISLFLSLMLVFSTVFMTKAVAVNADVVAKAGTTYKITSFTSDESDVSWSIPSSNKGKYTSHTGTQGAFKYVGLDSNTVVGDSISYTLKNVPAGSYYVLVNIANNTKAALFNATYNDGTQDILLGKQDQRSRRSKIECYSKVFFTCSLDYSYVHMSYANLVVKTTGDVTIKFTCYEPSIDSKSAIAIGSFLLKPDDNVSRWEDELPELEYDDGNAIDALKQQYGLDWSDEFNEGKLNYNNWSMYGTMRQADESYTTDTVAEGNLEFQTNCDGKNDGNGYMVMKQKPEPQGIKSTYSDNPNVTAAYDESHVDIYSGSKVTFQYGIIETRCKLPSKYVWASFWLLGNKAEQTGDDNDWPKSGEVDIFEYLPSEANPKSVPSATHCFNDNGGYNGFKSTGPGGSYTANSNLYEDFHTYGLIWTPHCFYYYCDNVIYGGGDISAQNFSEFRNRKNKILITSCARGYAVNKAPITEETNWIVDYVRIFGTDDIEADDRDYGFKAYDTRKLVSTGTVPGYTATNSEKTTVGNISTFDIPDMMPGKYRVYATNRTSSSTGKYDVSIGDTVIGKSIDFTAASKANSYKLGVVNITDSTGAKISFSCTESGKYNIERLIFVKVDDSALTAAEKSVMVTYSGSYKAEKSQTVYSELAVGRARYYSTADSLITSDSGETARAYLHGNVEYSTFGTCDYEYYTGSAGIKAGGYYQMDISDLDQGIYNLGVGYVGGNAPFKVQLVDEEGKITDIGAVQNTSGDTIDYFEDIVWSKLQDAKIRFTATGEGDSIRVVYVSLYKNANAPSENDVTLSEYYYPSYADNCLAYASFTQYEDSVITSFNAKSHGYNYKVEKKNTSRLADRRSLIYNQEYLRFSQQGDTLNYLPAGKYRLKALIANDSASRKTDNYGEFSFSAYEMTRGTYSDVSGTEQPCGKIDFATETKYTSYASDSARLYELGVFELKNGNNMIALKTQNISGNVSLFVFGFVAEPYNDVEKQAVDADDFSFTPPTDLTYDGAAKAAAVTVKDGIDGIGKITGIKYFKDGAEAEPINAGAYSVKVSVSEGDAYKSASDIEVGAFTIINAAQSAPNTVGKTDETLKDSADGTITGVDNTMEYRKSGDTEYTEISGNAVTGLAAGTYFVRYKAKANYNAGADAEVVIGAGAENSYNISAQPDAIDFGVMVVGYADVPSKTVKIKNDGNKSVIISAQAYDNYTVTGLGVTIAAGDTADITVAPKAKLAAGKYDVTIIILTANDTKAEIGVKLEVKDAALADYTKVDEAIAKIPADTDKYTSESVSAVQAAVDAVKRGLSADNQSTVDKYAQDIEGAILKLCLYGDCNNDGKVDAKDILLLKQYLANWKVVINSAAADVNVDTAVNAKDLLRLRQYLASWPVLLGKK